MKLQLTAVSISVNSIHIYLYLWYCLEPHLFNEKKRGLDRLNYPKKRVIIALKFVG